MRCTPFHHHLNERREQGVQPCLDGLEALIAEQAADMRL